MLKLHFLLKSIKVNLGLSFLRGREYIISDHILSTEPCFDTNQYKPVDWLGFQGKGVHGLICHSQMAKWMGFQAGWKGLFVIALGNSFLQLDSFSHSFSFCCGEGGQNSMFREDIWFRDSSLCSLFPWPYKVYLNLQVLVTLQVSWLSNSRFSCNLSFRRHLIDREFEKHICLWFYLMWLICLGLQGSKACLEDKSGLFYCGYLFYIMVDYSFFSFLVPYTVI